MPTGPTQTHPQKLINFCLTPQKKRKDQRMPMHTTPSEILVHRGVCILNGMAQRDIPYLSSVYTTGGNPWCLVESNWKHSSANSNVLALKKLISWAKILAMMKIFQNVKKTCKWFWKLHVWTKNWAYFWSSYLILNAFWVQDPLKLPKFQVARNCQPKSDNSQSRSANIFNK